MTTDRLANRWVIAVAAVIMQVCLGAVYGWSVFVKPLVAAHWALTEVSLTSPCDCLSGSGNGDWRTVAGSRRPAQGGHRCRNPLRTLVLLARWRRRTIRCRNLRGLWGIGGLGMGMGYICPVATLTKWFPERRGLMTGVAVFGYGAGALVMSPIAARVIIAVGMPATFLTLGVVYLILVVIAAQFYANPPQGWRPAGWEPRTAVSRAAST